MPRKCSTVAVVEDDLDVCDSVEAIITPLGHSCNTFDSAAALLRHWDKDVCDFLIIDVDLPEISGIELLSCLKKMNCCPPAILYTGQSNSRVRAAAVELGNVPIMEKGQDPAELTEYLRAVFAEEADELLKVS